MPKRIHLNVSGRGTLEDDKAEGVKSAYEAFVSAMADAGFVVKGDLQYHDLNPAAPPAEGQPPAEGAPPA